MEKISKKLKYVLVIGIFIAASCQLKKGGERQGADLVVVTDFWEEKARALPWFKTWGVVLEGKEDRARWFVGGQINASYAAVDTHVESGKGDWVALRWVSETGQEKIVTYKQLYDQVNAAAYALRNLGVKRGDRVVLYMPMIVESVVAMLALARLGAMHNVVFAGFSVQALADRINDCQASVVITADTSMRRGKTINLKQVVDDALQQCPNVNNVVVVQRDTEKCLEKKQKDVLWHEIMPTNTVGVEPETMDANDPLFVLYTSGTTGKPKGIVHSTGGYLTHVYWTLRWAFDPKPQDVYWCTADIGWITGHSYVVYGPLMHGLQVVLYEGAPDYPDIQVWWRLIERYKVSIFYTAPTALRLFMQHGSDAVDGIDLSSLKVLGTVGEPITAVVWQWYFDHIGKKKCPIIDTWWQTETGGIMIAPQAQNGLTGLVPGSVTKSLPGIFVDVVDAQGKKQEAGESGYVVIEKPWPGMMLGFLNEPSRVHELYWSKFPGTYYAGDFAMRDKDGNIWLFGRADEVLKIAGHRIGTAEIENAVLTNSYVADVAVVGVSDHIRGEVAAIFVVLKTGDIENQQKIKDEIISTVHKHMGNFVVIKSVIVIKKIPKTRSGKIMRRLLAAVAEGKRIDDLSTLEEGVSIDEISQELQLIMDSHRD